MCLLLQTLALKQPLNPTTPVFLELTALVLGERVSKLLAMRRGSNRVVPTLFSAVAAFQSLEQHHPHFTEGVEPRHKEAKQLVRAPTKSVWLWAQGVQFRNTRPSTVV